jgi:hypothetical protein
MLLAGCQQKNYNGPRRYPMTGKVTVDGEPVDEGSIALSDPSNTASLRGAGGEIVNGKFSIPEETGPNTGSYRVHISWLKKTGKKYHAPDTVDDVWYDARKEAVPLRFRGPESELTVDVPSPDGSYTFELKTK